MRIVIWSPCQRAKQPLTLALLDKLHKRADALAIRSELRRRAPRRCSFHDEPDGLFVETSFACFSCPFVSRRHIRSAHSVLTIAMTGDQGHPILYRP